MSSKSIIAITMGDPCGIGPEIVAKALAVPEITQECHPLVIGNAPLLRQTAVDLGLALDITPVSSAAQAADNAISILDPGNLRPEDVVPGQISAAAGRACVEWVLRAGELALSGDVQAMATAPINKEAAQAAGYKDIGHLELLQKLSEAPQVATMLTAGSLRVVHLTTHRSLAQAVAYVTRDNVLGKDRAYPDLLQGLGLRFAPHCGGGPEPAWRRRRAAGAGGDRRDRAGCGGRP